MKWKFYTFLKHLFILPIDDNNLKIYGYNSVSADHPLNTKRGIVLTTLKLKMFMKVLVKTKKCLIVVIIQLIHSFMIIQAS